jgi:hypothetical protein
MTKEEFLKLFELEEIYQEYKNTTPFSFGLHDNLIGTNNFIFFGFEDKNKIKFSIESVEFSEKIQELEIHFMINNNKIEINTNEIFKNEIFPFLTFDTNLDASLKFIADFINKILKPKYQLMGFAHIH